MKTAQNIQNGQWRRSASTELVTTLRGVRQDNPAHTTAPPATPQPAPQTKTLRSHEKITNSTRSQKGNEHRRKTIHLSIWVKPGVKEELQGIAASKGLSVSATASAFLEAALQHNLYTRQTALLDPIIDTSIRKHMRAYSNRLAVLLVRAMFEAGQTRAIVTNILGRQQGVTATVLEQILDRSSDTAKRNIVRVTPQLATLVKEIEAWIEEREGEQQK